jgi:hypothetical protein
VNKTLLIIICDFLLISILALVEFKPSVEEALVDKQALKEDAAEELLELLQLSLEHESSQRRQVEDFLDETKDQLGLTRESLQETQASLDEVSTSLEETTREKETLASTLVETRSSLQLTLREKADLESSLDANQERASRLQQELLTQQQIAATRDSELAEARGNLQELETEQRQMSTRLQILDTEKQMLQQNLLAARAEVDRARIEAERARERSESLAAGVSELAAESTALKEEIRQAQALSLNAIYRQFEENRIFIRFEWEEKYAFSTTLRQSALQSVLLDTDKGVFAVFAAENTPLATKRLTGLKAWLKVGQRSFSVTEIGYLEGDQRVASVQVPAEVARESGLKLFTIAADPLRFSTAVLVKDDQEMYGEIPVRIPPAERGLLEVESRLFNRIFGEFSPSVGDYVFSMSGELTGIMVSQDRARILQQPEFGKFYRLE